MDQLSFEFVENFIDEGIKLNKLGKFKTKSCIKCKKDLEFTEEMFIKKSYSRGLQNVCKTCSNSYTRSKVKERKTNNLCFSCHNPKLPNHVGCEYHACYNLVSNQQRLGKFVDLKGKDKKRFVFSLLEKLKDQNNRCVITGEELHFGLNISLDHIVSSTKGGTDDLDNLQWVTLKANKEKGAS